MSVTSPAKQFDIPALTGLRIVGAMWVVLYHFQPQLYSAFPRLRVFEPILANGGFGVPLFFTLSGYLIWRNYGERGILKFRATVRFIWRRYARLWPVNVLAQLLVIPLWMWAVNVKNLWGSPIPGWYSVPGWFASAFMVGGLSDSHVTYAWDQPAWSLTAEMIAYFMFPILLIIAIFLGVNKVPQRARWIFLILGFATAWAAQSYTGLFPYSWLSYLALMFIVGAFLAIAGEFRPKNTFWASALQFAAPSGVVIFTYRNEPTIIVLFIVLWVWSLTTNLGLLARFFSTPPLQILGQASYSVYMLHWIVFGYFSLGADYAPVPAGFLLKVWTLSQLVVVIVVSYFCWRAFETPAREAINRSFDRVWPSKSRAVSSDNSTDKPVEGTGTAVT